MVIMKTTAAVNLSLLLTTDMADSNEVRESEWQDYLLVDKHVLYLSKCCSLISWK